MSDLQRQLKKKIISHSGFKLPSMPGGTTDLSHNISLQAPAVFGKSQAPSYGQAFDDKKYDSGYRDPFYDEDQDGHDEERDGFPSELGSVVPNSSSSSRRSLSSSFQYPDAEPVETRSWSDYFDENFQITASEPDDSGQIASFNVFISAPDSSEAPIFVFHHGAGSGALSFAPLAKSIRELMALEKEASYDSNSKDAGFSSMIRPDNNDLTVAGAIAFDVRGHGATTLTDQSINNDDNNNDNDNNDNDNNNGNAPIDYSLDKLTDDFLFVLSGIAKRQKWDELASPPRLVFVGHSLGGAVVTHAALKLKQAGLVSSSSSSVFRNLMGLVVLDVVEGSAIEALQSMNQILKTRPTSFNDINDAISWHLKSKTLRSKESAAVSVPGILKPVNRSPPSLTSEQCLTWITDLRETENYWKQWFTGLSSKFLQAPTAKLLILAGTDRLDKDLMIGQMQGKYQLIVFQESGHFVHEDNPTKTALALIDFFKRNDRSGFPKVLPTFGKFNE